jgi:hypothetical protein
MGYYDRDFNTREFCKQHGLELTNCNVGFSTLFIVYKDGQELGRKEHFGGWWDLSLGPWLNWIVDNKVNVK